MTNFAEKPIALIILDGWGHSPEKEGNAIAAAHTPNYDDICARYPMTTLAAAGTPVGQSSDANGNAEVGHLNLGSGRVAHSEIFQVESAIRSRQFTKNSILTQAIGTTRDSGNALHLIGLLSDGGVHSSTDSLFALLRMAKSAGVENVFIHAILDGVDVQTRTADIYVEALEIKLADIGVGKIATLCGRYFAMDSGGNWERTARAYTMLVHAEGERSNDAMSAIRNSFLRGIADEFVAPVVLESAPDTPVATIKDGDTVIFFNHRPDGIRQLVRSIAVPDSASLGKPEVKAVCLTEYDRGFNLPVAFPTEMNANVLSEVLADAGIPSLKITQTERFSHLTYFFNGGDEIQQPNEQHILMPTPQKISTELKPESQSFKIADRLIRSIDEVQRGVFVVNLPAADIAAESGSFAKTVEAVQFVDVCLGGILDKIKDSGGIAIVTSTHGNCEAFSQRSDTGTRHTTTPNPVPFHLVSDDLTDAQLRDDGTLADVAPTILNLLGIATPVEMTGYDLIIQ